MTCVVKPGGMNPGLRNLLFQIEIVLRVRGSITYARHARSIADIDVPTRNADMILRQFHESHG